VTHSQEEALAIADVIAVMNEGKLVQLGSPEELYTRPRNRFVAGFIGLANVFGATVHQIDGSDVLGVLPNGSRFHSVWHHGDARRTFSPGDAISVAVRPENVRLESAAETPAHGPTSSDLRLEGVVTASVFVGNLIDYFIEVAGMPTRIRAQSFAPALVSPGDRVVISMSRENCVLLED
jgi:ABC-type Fe3+/spermidine/putrescine transport system ATPase subunit